MEKGIINRKSKDAKNLGICVGVLSLVSAFPFIFAASIGAGTFLDDFNDGNDDGWIVFAEEWEVIDGEYKMTEETNGPPRPLTFALDGKEYGEFTIEAKMRNDKFHTVNQSHTGFAFGLDNEANGYILYFRHHKGISCATGTLVLRWMVEGTKGGTDPNADIAEICDILDAGDKEEWHVLKLEVSAKNGTIKAWADGKEAMDLEAGDLPPGKSLFGKLGLWTGKIGAASFDDVSISGPRIPSSDVQSGGKLSTAWGSIKAKY